MRLPRKLSTCACFFQIRFWPLVLAVATFCIWGCGQSESGRTHNSGSPKRIVIPKLVGEIAVDARLDEPVWQLAVPLSLGEKTGEKPPREATEVRLWYDEDALYLAWTCYDTDIQATFTERDSRFWEEEVCEFFVTADNLEQYFELQWNPLGGEFDAIIDNQLDDAGLSHGIEGHWEFTATTMKSAVVVDGTVSNSGDTDTNWLIEVKVPFSDLGVATPRPGDTWRGNFYRFNRGNGYEAELLAWSPVTLRSFHQPSQFGYLVFGGED